MFLREADARVGLAAAARRSIERGPQSGVVAQECEAAGERGQKQTSKSAVGERLSAIIDDFCQDRILS